MSLKVYSQSIQLNSTKDTVICFNIPQGKFLLQTYYENQLNKELNRLSNNQLSLCDSVKKSLNNIIETQNTILKNRDNYIELKETEIVDLQLNLDKANKKIITLKHFNKVSIVVSFLTGASLMYLIK